MLPAGGTIIIANMAALSRPVTWSAACAEHAAPTAPMLAVVYPSFGTVRQTAPAAVPAPSVQTASMFARTRPESAKGAQAAPGRQAAAQGPPQSTPASPPFYTAFG
jgi:hypothetical protein